VTQTKQPPANPGRFITHHVSILTMNGDSYRLKQSAGRRRTAARTEQNQANAAAPETGEITQS
jgi:hypothetical protein